MRATVAWVSGWMVCALAGCGEGGEQAPRAADAAVPDAAVSDAALPDAAVPDAAVPDAAAPDAAAPDAALPDAALPDAAAPDAAPPDAAAPDAPPADDPASTRATAVWLDGRLLAGVGADVQDADPGAPAAAPMPRLHLDGPLREALVAAPEGVEGARLFAVVEVEGRRRLEAFAADGTPAWTLDAQLPEAVDVRRPAVRNDRIFTAVRDVDGLATALWLDRRTGAVLARHALGAEPVTAAARLRSDDGEWILGVGARLVALRAEEVAPPGEGGFVETATFDTGLAEVTSVVSSGGWLLAAAGFATPGPRAEADGVLGDRLVMVGATTAEPTGTSLFAIGHPLSTPGPIEAPPVLARAVPVCRGADCTVPYDGVVASGGSHWFGGWQAETGAPVFLREDLPERVTGLAVGDRGRFFSGGSHWLPGTPDAGAVVRGFRLEADAGGAIGLVETATLDGEAAAGGAPVAGVSSPIVREGEVLSVAAGLDGSLTVLRLADAAAAPTSCGWPRAYGDDANSGNHVMTDSALCGGQP